MNVQSNQSVQRRICEEDETVHCQRQSHWDDWVMGHLRLSRAEKENSGVLFPGRTAPTCRTVHTLPSQIQNKVLFSCLGSSLPTWLTIHRCAFQTQLNLPDKSPWLTYLHDLPTCLTYPPTYHHIPALKQSPKSFCRARSSKLDKTPRLVFILIQYSSNSTKQEILGRQCYLF